MPRGALIFPMRVTLGLLDTAAVAATDPDGAGALTGGYDDEFREPRKWRASDQGSVPGKTVRVERRIRLYAQVEDDTNAMLEMGASGNTPQSQIGLVFHFQELEAAGAVHLASGKPIIHSPGARLISIDDPKTGELIESYEEAPGYWATQVKSMGFGLGLNLTSKRNLLLVIFQERDLSIGSAGA